MLLLIFNVYYEEKGLSHQCRYDVVLQDMAFISDLNLLHRVQVWCCFAWHGLYPRSDPLSYFGIARHMRVIYNVQVMLSQYSGGFFVGILSLHYRGPREVGAWVAPGYVVMVYLKSSRIGFQNLLWRCSRRVSSMAARAETAGDSLCVTATESWDVRLLMINEFFLMYTIITANSIYGHSWGVWSGQTKTVRL